MAAIDILKTDAPEATFYTHMNWLYLLLDMNSECFRGQDYSTIEVSLTAYNEDIVGGINIDDAVESWSRT